jgi:hypothetical protein
MATDGATLTIELPLSQAHVQALRHHVWSQRRWFLGTFAVAIAFGAFVALLPNAGRAVRLWDVVLAFSVAASMVLVADWLFWRRPLEAAVRHGVYLRTTGPIRTSCTMNPSSDGTDYVSVGDVTIKHVPFSNASELRRLPWGTLDYVPGVHIVIEQRDADGELLYRHPEYRPDYPAVDDGPER